MARAVTATTTCAVCANRGEGKAHVATERMFGYGGSFTYLECPNCGSLALSDVPASLSPYYPPDYYSVAGRNEPVSRSAASVGRRLLMQCVLASPGTAKVVVRGGAAGGVGVERWIELLGGSGLGLASRILDVGCGDGHRLRTFRRAGFTNLVGIDAHLVHETHEPSLELSRASLGELRTSFDLVMFHHSFEHMPDPVETLREAHRLLAPGGLLLLRVPLAGSWAWRTYGTEWVQLDVPRHLFLFTATGLRAVAGRAGFALRGVVYDSGSFQIWGSELYSRNQTLAASGSLDGAPPSIFPRALVKRWNRAARKLNEAGDGDQAAFLFVSSPESVTSPQ